MPDPNMDSMLWIYDNDLDIYYICCCYEMVGKSGYIYRMGMRLINMKGMHTRISSIIFDR